MTEKLPLFPLSTVLFPGARLTLHIFEARYRLMIEQCLEEGTPFGVTLIREGREVGDQSTIPHSIGTVARITESVRLDDGRYYLAAVGVDRFRIQYPVQRLPFLIMAVTLLPEESHSEVRSAADELRSLYQRYWEAIQQMTGQDEGGDELDDDPLLMSYQIANLLQVPNALKQHWLEANAHTRMRELSLALRKELNLLPRPSSGTVRAPWRSFGSWN